MNQKKNPDLYLRECGPEDVPQILALQKQVIDALEDKNLLRKNTREMFERCVQPPHYTLGVYDGSDMVAVSILYDPQGDEEDLSKNLRCHTVEKGANYKLALVSPQYRGRGLQRKMLYFLEKYAYHTGYTHLCTTVSPDNLYSMRNVLACDYEKDHEAIKYGGLKRIVLCKNIKEAYEAKEASCHCAELPEIDFKKEDIHE